MFDIVSKQLIYVDIQSKVVNSDSRYPHDVNHVNFIFSSFLEAHKQRLFHVYYHVV